MAQNTVQKSVTILVFKTCADRDKGDPGLATERVVATTLKEFEDCTEAKRPLAYIDEIGRYLASWCDAYLHLC